MTPVRWWGVLGALSLGVVLLDIVSSPHILFPIAFVVPVGLAAWHLGRGAGIGFAVTLVGCRLAIVLTLEHKLTPMWAAAANASIRLVVLAGLAVLLAKVAQQRRMLARRVSTLEGLLPICAFCKKIREPDGTWEQIEVYVSRRSAAEFSHGFCEACAHKHYPEYFRAPESPQSGSG